MDNNFFKVLLIILIYLEPKLPIPITNIFNFIYNVVYPPST